MFIGAWMDRLKLQGDRSMGLQVYKGLEIESLVIKKTVRSCQMSLAALVMIIGVKHGLIAPNVHCGVGPILKLLISLHLTCYRSFGICFN